MDGRKLPSLVWTAFGIAFAALVLDAGGGPGWGTSAAHTMLATRAEHLATSPLYDVLASAFALLPAGEPGFRLGLLAALLGACTLAGVVAAARALLPKDPAAGVVGAALLVVAPPFREAAASASPTLLGAAGLVWSLALAIRFARERDARDVLGAIAACLLVIGSAPWLGGAWLVTLVVGLAVAGARPDLLAIAMAGVGLSIAVLWLDAGGSLPVRAGGVAALAAAGRGAAAIVVGAGLLGAAFAALTSLPHARWIGAAILVALVHEAIVGGAAPVVLAGLAVGAAVIPSAIVRVAAGASTGVKRHLVTLAAGLPLVGVAAITGATFTVDDPGATPSQLAHDLVDAVPPGNGIFVTTRGATWLAVQHEMKVAGGRPDLVLVPPLAAEQADAFVANALRGKLTVGADAAAFGRLDIQRAIPRGRGFQLVGELAAATWSVVGPAQYPTPKGQEQAVLLALERARFEAAGGRLDAAARAVGLEARFGAADLAVLAATVPSRERPALFGFLPLTHERPGTWLLDVFGDDLAWVAGIEVAAPDPRAPIARRLHALWRQILLGTLKPDDPAIAALGPAAVAATQAVFTPAK